MVVPVFVRRGLQGLSQMPVTNDSDQSVGLFLTSVSLQLTKGEKRQSGRISIASGDRLRPLQGTTDER